MKATVPRARLIVALRNPVHRAISHFVGKAKSEFRDFSSCTGKSQEYGRYFVTKCDALRPREMDAARVGTGVWPMDSATQSAWTRYTKCALAAGDNPIARSMYAPQLFAWLQHYEPFQLHVTQSERLFERPQEEVRRITDWLGWRPHHQHEASAFGDIVGSSHMKKFGRLKLVKSAANPLDCDVPELTAFFSKYEDDLWDLLNSAYPGEASRFERWSSAGVT